MTSRGNIFAIAAVTLNRVIGNEHALPWRSMPSDMQHFRLVTTGHTVVMGWKTFESIIGRRKGPLRNRINLVLTREHAHLVRREGAIPIASVEDVLDIPTSQVVFVMGGAQIYRLMFPYISKLFLTLVHANISGDAYFPEITGGDWEVEMQSGPLKWDPRDEFVSNRIIYRRR
jgi:dihydrofolate reductase